jgi:hypothetical protein
LSWSLIGLLAEFLNQVLDAALITAPVLDQNLFVLTFFANASHVLLASNNLWKTIPLHSTKIFSALLAFETVRSVLGAVSD